MKSILLGINPLISSWDRINDLQDVNDAQFMIHKDPDCRLPACLSPAVLIYPHFFLDLFTWCLSVSRSEFWLHGSNKTRLLITSTAFWCHFLNRTMLCLFGSVSLNGFTCRFLCLRLNPASLLFTFFSASDTRYGTFILQLMLII